MITLTKIEQLDNLPLACKLKTFLHNQLVRQPFDTTKAALDSWQQLDNRLIILEQHEDPHTLPHFPRHLINPVIEFPEYILKAPENYILTLSIVDQAGSGLYLLFPSNTTCSELRALTRWADEA